MAEGRGKIQMRKIILLLAVMLSGVEASFSQTGNVPIMKTMQDSVFNVGDIIKIPIIVFDLNGGRPTEESKDSLGQVAKFLKKYPKLVVEMGSHTDYRSDTRYNQVLSFRRAKYCVDYIVNELGIDSARITPVGYGESKPTYLFKDIILPSGRIVKTGTHLTEQWIDKNYPVKKNKDDYETLMRQNRRTELKVLRTDFGK